MQKVKFFLILVMFIFLIVGCKKENVLPLQDGVLTVGMECAYAPFNWTTITETENSVPISGTNNFCDGYDVKVARILADSLDVKLEIKALPFESLIEALNVNDIDAIIAGMSPTAERKQTIAFTDVYYRSEQVVVVKKNGPYQNAKSVTDFSGARISAQLGTLQVNLIEQLTGAILHTPLDDYPLLVHALNSSDIDGFIAEVPVANQIINTNNNLTYVTLTEKAFVVDDSEVTIAIGLRKTDTDLLKQLNATLKTITLLEREAWMEKFILATTGEI